LTLNRVCVTINLTQRKSRMKIRCQDCKVLFRNNVALQQHKCPVTDEELTTKEMLSRYREQQKAA